MYKKYMFISNIYIASLYKRSEILVPNQFTDELLYTLLIQFSPLAFIAELLYSYYECGHREKYVEC